MECTKCHCDISEGLKFCGECGTRVEKSCPECGNSNPLSLERTQ
jgi:hypothetical protein